MNKHDLFAQMKKYSDKLYAARQQGFDEEKRVRISCDILKAIKRLRKLDKEDKRLVEYIEMEAKRLASADLVRDDTEEAPGWDSVSDGSVPACFEYLEDCPKDAEKWYIPLHS